MPSRSGKASLLSLDRYSISDIIMFAKGETGTPDPTEEKEQKEWAEEQQRLKRELKSLMSSDMKNTPTEKKSDKGQEDRLFEKAFGKMSKDGPKEDTAKEPMKEEPAQKPQPQEAAQKQPEIAIAPAPQAMQEEPADEEKPAPEVKREIPKPKDLAEKLGKVMAAEKKVDTAEDMEEEPVQEVKRELPKPRGLADMIGKVMAAENKPDAEKVAKKADYTRFAAKEIGLKNKDGPLIPSKTQLAHEAVPAQPQPAPAPQGTPQPGTVVKKPVQPSQSSQVPVKQPVQPIPVKTLTPQPVQVKQPVAPAKPAPAPQSTQPAAAKDELGEETDSSKDAQFEEGIMVKDGDTSVKSIIEHTEALITKAPEYIDLSRPKKLIHKAKESLAEGDSEEANKLAQEARQKIIEIRNDFINAKKLLKLSKERLLTAKDKGYNINKAKSHYQMALKLLKKNDHIMSMQYAKLCLREIERNEMGI